MKDKLMEYLKNFLIQNEWCYRYTREQARAMFTTLCLMENIDADTVVCDLILGELYNLIDFAEYEAFESFMVELIV